MGTVTEPTQSVVRPWYVLPTGRAFAASVLFLLVNLASVAIAGEVRRDIIAVSNATQFGYNPAHMETRALAETPLNHLGLRVHQVDWSESGVPSAELSAAARGALIWFHGEQLEDPEQFLNWAIEFMEGGAYLVLTGEPAFLHDLDGQPTDPELLNRFYRTLGLDYHARFLDNYETLTIRTQDPDFIAFERPIHDQLSNSVPFQTQRSRGLPVYLALEDRLGQTSDVIAITAAGAVSILNFTYQKYQHYDMGFWLINPIEFFRAAYRMHGVPTPDTTTLAGNRIYYSHVNGDGWNDISAVPLENGILDINASVMLEKLIRPYPGLPVTVAPITGDLDLSLGGTRHSREVAGRILRQYQVEAGSHTHTHPNRWQYFETISYDPVSESESFGHRSPLGNLLTRLVHHTRSLIGLRGPADNTDNLIARDTQNLPRTYLGGSFDFETDLRRSLTTLQELLPERKSVKVMQWSGDSLPDESALATARALGLRNINGGETRYDSAFPSLSYISPLGRRVGDEFQVYSSMATDAFFSQVWTDRYYGFRDLKTTIDRTDKPYRLRPINVNYHVYSAQQPSSLQEVRENLDYVQTLPVAPIATSHYLGIIQGWLSATIEPLKQGWRITDRGELNTLRLDASGYQIDYRRSRGVIGHRSHQGSLYIALDPAIDDVELHWLNTDGDSSVPVSDHAALPFLVSSRWPVSDVHRQPNALTLRTGGYGSGLMRWQFPSRCTGKAAFTRIDDSGDPAANPTSQIDTLLNIQSDENGIVSIPLSQAEEPDADTSGSRQAGQGSRLIISCQPGDRLKS